MTTLDIFCRQLRARSAEHRRALHLLYDAGLMSQIMAILRQELDSMIRVFYLLSLSDLSYREDLIRGSVEGREWTDKSGKHRITDRQMVEHANKLHGWVKAVYRFGCAFIHLSNLHDYQERDPLSIIPADEKEAILSYIRSYHGGPTQSDPGLNELMPFLPKVFDKIANNLKYYIEDLESGKIPEL